MIGRRLAVTYSILSTFRHDTVHFTGKVFCICFHLLALDYRRIGTVRGLRDPRITGYPAEIVAEHYASHAQHYGQ